LGIPKTVNADWIRLETRDSPSPRASAAIVYGEVRANLVPLGGFNDADGGLGDTWIFDGFNWTEVDPVRRPSERATHNLCWCPRSEQLVFVTGVRFSPAGGHNPITGGRVWSQHNLGDTWIFDGENWQELDLETQPAHRQFGAMSSHPDERGVLLFGGHGGSGKSHLLGDTWGVPMSEPPSP